MLRYSPSAAVQDSPFLQSLMAFSTEKDGHLFGFTPLDVSAYTGNSCNRVFGFFNMILFTYSHKPDDQPKEMRRAFLEGWRSGKRRYWVEKVGRKIEVSYE